MPRTTMPNKHMASATELLPLLRVLCFAVGVDRQGLAAFLVNEAYARHHA
jgi:hypothetical protein